MSNDAVGWKLSSCGLPCHCPLTYQIRYKTWRWVSLSMGQDHYHLRRLHTHSFVMWLHSFPLAPIVHRHSSMCHTGTLLSLPLSSTINISRWCGIKDTHPYNLMYPKPYLQSIIWRKPCHHIKAILFIRYLNYDRKQTVFICGHETLYTVFVAWQELFF